MNLRRDGWLAGALIFLSCTSVVRTLIPGTSDIELFTGLSSIASFGLGSLLGFFVKNCPDRSVFVQEPMPSLTCPDSFTASTVGDETWCYKVIPDFLSREDATLKCAAEAETEAPRNANGRLIGIETVEEKEAVINFLTEIDALETEYWMDALDYDGDGTFIWGKNGATVQNVERGNRGVCALFFSDSNDMSFFNDFCFNSYEFVCESDQVQQS